MAPAAVRFHPAAAQETEEAYEWYATRNPSGHTAFARNYGTRSMRSPRIQALGRAMDVALGGTSFHDFHSAWCTSSVVTKLKSSPSLTGGDGRDTGARECEVPELAAARYKSIGAKA